MQDIVSKPKKIKVCYAITKGLWGGAQEYVYTLATSLPKDTYDVVVLCGEGNALPEKLQASGVRTITLGSIRRDVSIFTDLHGLWEMYRILRAESPDVLHLNSSKIGFTGGLAGRLARVPRIIFTAHGWSFNESRPWLVRKFFKIMHWLSVLLSHITIAVSRKTKQDIDSMPWIKDKVFVLHNGIAPIDFVSKDEARGKMAEVLGLPRLTQTVVGTISELHSNKGLDLLISVAKMLPESASVIIVGQGQEKESLLSQIKELGLEGRVFLAGRIDNAKTLLKAFDIFTLTSRTEALPYTILEAGLAGLPVVASRVGGIPEIIENGKSGILIPRTKDELERALEFLLAKPEKGHIFGNNLKVSVENNFSISNMIRNIQKFYTMD